MSRWIVAAGATLIIVFTGASGPVEGQEGLVLPQARTARDDYGWRRLGDLAAGTRIEVVTKTGSTLRGPLVLAGALDVKIRDTARGTTALARGEIAEIRQLRTPWQHKAAIGALIGAGAGFATAAVAAGGVTHLGKEYAPFFAMLFSGIGAGAGAAIGAAVARHKTSDFDVVYRD